MAGDRQVKVTLVIDDKGSVKVLRQAANESEHAEGKLKKLDKGVQGLGKSFRGLKGLIAGGIAGIGLGGLAFGLSDVISKTKEVATETEKFSSVTGIGAAASLRYTQALKARGLSGETVTKAFGFLAKNLKSAELQENLFAKSQVKAAAKGQLTTTVLGRQAQALKELTGLSADQFKALGSEEDKLRTVTKAFEGLADGEKKTRLERELFGRGGNQLSIVLDKNNLSLNHQIALVEKFYPTLKGGSRGLQELNERSAESKMAWEGFQFTLGTGLIPILNKAMGAFANVVAEAQKGKGPLHEIEAVFEGIAHFAGGAIGVAKELFKIFGVKLPAGTLGAVLAAVGLHSVKHPVKVSKTAGTATKDLAKWTLSHPEFAPLTAGIIAGGAAGIPLNKKFPEGLFPGPSLNEVERTLLGLPRRAGAGPAGHGKETLRGTPRSGGETPGEAALVAKAIESLKPTHDERQVHINIDSVRVATAMLRNPRARREIAEAVAIYGQQMAAKK